MGQGKTFTPREVVRSPSLALTLGCVGRSLIRLCLCFGVLSCWWPSPSRNRLIIGRQFEGCVSWGFSLLKYVALCPLTDTINISDVVFSGSALGSCSSSAILSPLLEEHICSGLSGKSWSSRDHTLCPSAPLYWPLHLLFFMVGCGNLSCPWILFLSHFLKVVCITLSLSSWRQEPCLGCFFVLNLRNSTGHISITE